MKKNTGEIALHVLGCIAFMAIPLLFRPGAMDSFDVFVDSFDVFNDPRAGSDFLTYLLLVAFFYLNYLVLVPSLYFNGRNAAFTVAVCASFLFILFVPDLLFDHAPPPPAHRMHGPPDPPRPSAMPFVLFKAGNVLLLFLIAFFLSLMLRITMRWKQSEKEKLRAELSYLKAQINPHFLFNTLNSIYALAIARSDKTASAVVKLSGMMRYVINGSHREFVPLEMELDYLRDYVALQGIRFDTALDLGFKVKGDMQNKKIAPLVLIPFVENAFKHGVNPEQDSAITIDVVIGEHLLTLTVFNKKVHVDHTTGERSGIGIDNTRERMEMLYGQRHTLSIDDTPAGFRVTLTVPIV